MPAAIAEATPGGRLDQQVASQPRALQGGPAAPGPPRRQQPLRLIIIVGIVTGIVTILIAIWKAFTV